MVIYDSDEKAVQGLILVPQVKSGKARRGKDGKLLVPDQESWAINIEAKRQESIGLARAIGIEIVDARIVTLPRLNPSELFGSGKVIEIAGQIAAQDIDLVMVDHQLSPIQQRNLEKSWKVKVLDRTGLILEIFGDRAQTREGRLQVELAHLNYQKSRLVRSWTHLERQRGGAGFMGGPGETQIESDRRQIQDRIIAIEKRLAKVVKTRELHRQGRGKVPYPVVAFVGYTNAGKSTLFNKVSGADVFAQDLLFATLDPTMREIELPSGAKIILSDTVGFISELPTMLVAAFRATLEEVLSADLIIHVRDIASPNSEEQCKDVEKVLAELGVKVGELQHDMLEVWNKADLLSAEERQHLQILEEGNENALMVSSLSGEGVEELLAKIDEVLSSAHSVLNVSISPRDGRLLSWLYEHGLVLGRTDQDDGTMLFETRLSAKDKALLERQLHGTQSAIVG